MELTDVSVTLMKLKPGMVCVCTCTHLPVCECTCAEAYLFCGTLVEIRGQLHELFFTETKLRLPGYFIATCLTSWNFPILSIPPFCVCVCVRVHVCACEVQKSTLVVIIQILSLIFWVGSLIGVMLSHLSPPTSARIIITLSLTFLLRFWGLNWSPQDYATGTFWPSYFLTLKLYFKITSTFSHFFLTG